jgi:hypothetical protein
MRDKKIEIFQVKDGLQDVDFLLKNPKPLVWSRTFAFTVLIPKIGIFNPLRFKLKFMIIY